MKKFDVAVIGSGPAGASAALKLGVSPEHNSVAKFAIIHESFAAYGGGG